MKVVTIACQKIFTSANRIQLILNPPDIEKQVSILPQLNLGSVGVLHRPPRLKGRCSVLVRRGFHLDLQSGSQHFLAKGLVLE